jgi:hypothetical protein
MGGASTMILRRDGEDLATVINNPKEGPERPVTSAIAIVRKKSEQNLSLEDILL